MAYRAPPVNLTVEATRPQNETQADKIRSLENSVYWMNLTMEQLRREIYKDTTFVPNAELLANSVRSVEKAERAIENLIRSFTGERTNPVLRSLDSSRFDGNLADFRGRPGIVHHTIQPRLPTLERHLADDPEGQAVIQNLLNEMIAARRAMHHN